MSAVPWLSVQSCSNEFYYSHGLISNCSLWKFSKDDDVSAFELRRQITYLFLLCGLLHFKLQSLKFNKDDDVSAFELQRQITYLFLLCWLLSTYTVSILLSVYFYFFCHSIQALQFQELEWVVLGAFHVQNTAKQVLLQFMQRKLGFLSLYS